MYINAMLLSLVFPFFPTFKKYLMMKLTIFWDSKCDLKWTKTWTVFELAEKWSSPVFEINGQYPKIMTVILVCMLYGLLMPLMFVIVFVFLVLTYIFHKILIVYFYWKPPLYDNTLNWYFIYYVKYGALFYIMFSFWILTNR